MRVTKMTAPGTENEVYTMGIRYSGAISPEKAQKGAGADTGTAAMRRRRCQVGKTAAIPDGEGANVVKTKACIFCAAASGRYGLFS